MSESLKIAFYTDTYLPAVDGVVTSIINSKKELERRGHHVSIFTTSSSISKPFTEIERNVYAVHGVKFKKYPQYRMALFPFLAAAKLTKINPDVMHAHTPFMMGISGLSMAKINRIPIAATFHTFFANRSVLEDYGLSSNLGQRVINRYSWPYARFFFNRCDRVIAPSETAKNVLKRHRINNISVVPNSVDTRVFNPEVNGDRVKRMMTRNRKDRIVLHVGRMSREKRVDVIIKAAARLKGKGIKFVFAGSGPALHRYQQMAFRYGLRDSVRFLGFVPEEQLPKYYAAADLFCTASTFETQGVVLLEALATGKPVVGADFLAIKEIIRNGRNGEKFKAGDSAACARKIEKVLNNLDSYKETVSTADLYSVPKTTDILLNVYRQIISGGYI